MGKRLYIYVFAYPAYPAYKRTPEKKHTAWICMARSGWDDLLPLCCYWPAKPKVNELPETELHKQPSTAVIPGRDGNSQWQRTGNATPLRGITGESWRTTGSWKPGAPSMLREVMEKSLSPSSWSVLGFWAFWSLKSPYWLKSPNSSWSFKFRWGFATSPNCVSLLRLESLQLSDFLMLHSSHPDTPG